MGAKFTFPSGPDFSHNFTVGQQVVATWQDATNYTELSLGLGQIVDGSKGLGGIGLISWMISNDLLYTGQNYQWTVTTQGQNLSISDSFALVMVNGTNFGLPVASSLFKIFEPNSDAASSFSSSPTVASRVPLSSTSFLPSSLPTSRTANTASFLPSSTIRASSAGTASAPSSTIDSAANSAASSLTAGAKAGIGIGVSVLFLTVGALGWFMFMRWKKGTTAGSSQRLHDGFIMDSGSAKWQNLSPPEYQKTGGLLETQRSHQIYEAP